MMSPRSLISLAIILIVTHQQHQSAESKALNVKYQVKFRRLPPKEFSAALGSSITIECEAGASPPPTIHWLKNGKRIYLSELESNQLEDGAEGQSAVPVDDVNRIALSATRSRLYIDCAQEQDQATYTCVAENAYSRISSHTKLNLIMPAVQGAPMAAAENDLPLRELAGEGAALAGLRAGAQQGGQRESGAATNIDLTAVPQCLSDQLTGGTPPQAPVRIHMWTHNILEIVKNNVIIYCRSNVNRQSVPADGGPDSAHAKAQQEALGGALGRNKAATLWSLPDDKLVSEHMKDKYEVLETGDLLIKNLSWSDMGSYVCTVSDERGSDSISAFVYPAAVKVNSKRSAAPASTNWDLNIRYTGNPAHLKLRLVFTAESLLRQRPRGAAAPRARSTISSTRVPTRTAAAAAAAATAAKAAAAPGERPSAQKRQRDELELERRSQRSTQEEDEEEDEGGNSHKSKEGADGGGGSGVEGLSAGEANNLFRAPSGPHETDHLTNVQYQATYLLTKRPIDQRGPRDKDGEQQQQLVEGPHDEQVPASDAGHHRHDASGAQWTLVSERPQRPPRAPYDTDDKNNNNNISNIYNSSDSVDDNEERQQNDINYDLASVLRRQGFEFRVVSVPSARPEGGCQCCLNFRKETKAKWGRSSKWRSPKQDQDDKQHEQEHRRRHVGQQRDVRQKSVPVKEFEERKDSLIKSNVGERIVQSNATKSTETNRAKPVTDLGAHFFLSSATTSGERALEPSLSSAQGAKSGAFSRLAAHFSSGRFVQDDDTLAALVVRREVGRNWQDMTLNMTSNNRFISDRSSDWRRAQASKLAATLASGAGLASAIRGSSGQKARQGGQKQAAASIDHSLELLMRNHYLPARESGNCSHLLLGAHCCHCCRCRCCCCRCCRCCLRESTGTSRLNGTRRKKARDTAGFGVDAGAEPSATCGAISFLCALCHTLALGRGGGAESSAGQQASWQLGARSNVPARCHCCRSCSEFTPLYRRWLAAAHQRRLPERPEAFAAGFARPGARAPDDEADSASRNHERSRAELERGEEDAHDDDDPHERDQAKEDERRLSPLSSALNGWQITDVDDDGRFELLLNELFQENQKIGVASANNGDAARSLPRDTRRGASGQLSMELAQQPRQQQKEQPMTELLDARLAQWAKSLEAGGHTSEDDESDERKMPPLEWPHATGFSKSCCPCRYGSCRSAHGETLLVIMEKYAPGTSGRRNARFQSRDDTQPSGASPLSPSRPQASTSARRARAGGRPMKEGAASAVADGKRLEPRPRGAATREDDDEPNGEKSDRPRGSQSVLTRASRLSATGGAAGELLGGDGRVSGHHNGPSVKSTPTGKGAQIDSGNQDYADNSEHASGRGESKGPSGGGGGDADNEDDDDDVSRDGAGDSGGSNGTATSSEDAPQASTRRADEVTNGSARGRGADTVVGATHRDGQQQSAESRARQRRSRQIHTKQAHRRQAQAHKGDAVGGADSERLAQGEREYAILLAAIVIDVFNRTVQVKPDLNKLIMLDMRALDGRCRRPLVAPSASERARAAGCMQLVGAKHHAPCAHTSCMDAAAQQRHGGSLAELLFYHLEPVYEPAAVGAAERDLALARRELKLLQQVARPQLPIGSAERAVAGFLSPVNRSVLVNLQLDIHYLHELADKSCRGTFVKYKLYVRRQPRWNFRKLRESARQTSDDLSGGGGRAGNPSQHGETEQWAGVVGKASGRRQRARDDASGRKLGQVSHAVARESSWPASRRDLFVNSEHVASDEIEDEDAARWRAAVGAAPASERCSGGAANGEKLDESRRRLDCVRHGDVPDHAAAAAAAAAADGCADLLLLLEGSTITSRPNSSGCFHLCCAEQILFEASRSGSRWTEAPAGANGAQPAADARAPLESMRDEITEQRSSAVANRRDRDERDKRLDIGTTPAEAQDHTDGAGNVRCAMNESATMTMEVQDIADVSAASRAAATAAHDTMSSSEPSGRPSANQKPKLQTTQLDVCELVLVLEVYSSDFFGDKLQGWSSMSVPVALTRQGASVEPLGGAIAQAMNQRHVQTAASNKYRCTRRVDLPVTGPAFCAPLDRLRYHLIGELPKAMPKIESLVAANNRYLTLSRPNGKLALSYAVVCQFSDHQFDSILRDLLESKLKPDGNQCGQLTITHSGSVG